MAMWHPPRGVITPGPREIPPAESGGGVPVDPPPEYIPPIDPFPWMEAPMPREEEKTPPPPPPPVVVIEPVEKPPIILPPPPDMTPPTLVPPVYEEPWPEPMPMPPEGVIPTVRPPPTLVIAAAAGAIGTFMVYVGRKLVLTMAASLGTSLGKAAGTMLVGAVNKQLFRGTTIRFHSGQSYGDYHGSDFGGDKTKAVSYEQAWRMVPQEFSYWEA